MSVEKDPNGNKFIPYMREDRLPHIFCPGCGNGSIMNAFFKGMEEAEMDFDNDSLHTTHGRALSFATGLKVSNSDLDVVVFTGDGDAASIGGNHLIHAARRNINLTVICINNNIYGMTGGQISPTSPKGSFGTTAPYGNGDYPFKLAELVAAAGATYAARWTTDSIKTALKNPGFSFIEVVSQCPTYYGRKNNLKTPTAMAVTMKINTLSKEDAEGMSDDELIGKIVTGEFANKSRPEFSENIEKLSEDKSGSRTLVNSAYESDL